MKIDKVKFRYSDYDKRKDRCMDPGMEEEVDFNALRGFRNGTKSLFESLEEIAFGWLPEDAKHFGFVVRKDLYEEYGIEIRSAEIPVQITNPPFPSLSTITVVVDDDRGDGIVVKDKYGNVVLDLCEELMSYEYIDLTIRQLNKIINRVVNRKEKIQ